jgi:hypothetical protein
MEHTPIGDTTMKTIITGLALLTTLSLVSCGPKPQEDSKAAGFDKVGVSTNETEYHKQIFPYIKKELENGNQGLRTSLRLAMYVTIFEKEVNLNITK